MGVVLLTVTLYNARLYTLDASQVTARENQNITDVYKIISSINVAEAVNSTSCIIDLQTCV